MKVEKFMIGFDIGGYKISWRWGETEYGIGILPLGGYVKMLGQDDDPAHIAEQMQKSQIDASQRQCRTRSPARTARQYYVDRRSYLAKSVPQRMAIISAGVIMNIIFAFIFAVDRVWHGRARICRALFRRPCPARPRGKQDWSPATKSFRSAIA